MKRQIVIYKLRGRCGSFVLFIIGLVAGSALGAEAPATITATATNATTAAAEIVQSVFVIPNSREEGRNPFFPNSTLGAPVPRPKTVETKDVYSFVLNGITSPPRSTAIINGRTFEVGEEGEIRMASGARILIKCEEITTDSARISVNGEKRLLRLRSGL
jgi:hypothetical protein